MTHLKTSLLALATALALAACGGGSSTADTTPRSSINSVKVFGDSLADSGTFGYKFTVASTDGFVYPERIAQAYGQTLCAFYNFNGTTFVPKTTCTNFAIGGGVINAASSSNATAPSPLGIQVQLATAGSLGFTATDLALIDGGGNDAAALVTAFLTAQATSNPTNLYALLSSLLPPATVQAALAGGASTTAQIGGAYMVALADQLAASVTTNVLGKGAQQVAILNMPAVTKTPLFQAALAQVAAGAGGGAAGATAAAQVEALANQWFQAYNAELASKFAAEPRVVVIDFYSAFLDEIAHPDQYGLTNVTTPLCSGATEFPNCTATGLSANPPTGVTDPNWWKSYAFANSFHPTPYGHQLTAQLISLALTKKGWL